jgi:hypothetical protein
MHKFKDSFDEATGKAGGYAHGEFAADQLVLYCGTIAQNGPTLEASVSTYKVAVVPGAPQNARKERKENVVLVCIKSLCARPQTRSRAAAVRTLQSNLFLSAFASSLLLPLLHH